jgi:hypothetical protein
MDKGTVAFLMPDNLSRHNLQHGDHAAYLFMEDGPGYKGVRLFLTKIREEKNPEILQSIESEYSPLKEIEANSSRSLVFFKVDKMLPLIE